MNNYRNAKFNIFRWRSRCLESLRFANENEAEYELCPPEVWCFDLPLEIKNNRFHVVYPVFWRVYKEQICVTTAITLYMDDTLDGKDVLVDFFAGWK